MRTATTFSLGLLITLLALAVSPAPAAADCPWCVTPTTCSQVEENTPIAACYNRGNGCQTLSGECEISFAFNTEAGRKATLRKNQIEYRGQVAAEIWGIKMNLTAINDGLFAEWNCSGQLSNLFRRDAKGGWTAVDVGAFQSRFALEDLPSVRAERVVAP